MAIPAVREPGPLVILLRLRTVAKVDSIVIWSRSPMRLSDQAIRVVVPQPWLVDPAEPQAAPKNHTAGACCTGAAWRPKPAHASRVHATRCARRQAVWYVAATAPSPTGRSGTWQRSHVFEFEYLAGRGIEPNPLYRKLVDLGMPDEQIRVVSIIDASKLSNGHIAWLQKGWPDLFDRLSLALPRLKEWA
jgi:hypothetical protein